MERVSASCIRSITSLAVRAAPEWAEEALEEEYLLPVWLGATDLTAADIVMRCYEIVLEMAGKCTVGVREVWKAISPSPASFHTYSEGRDKALHVISRPHQGRRQWSRCYRVGLQADVVDSASSLDGVVDMGPRKHIPSPNFDDMSSSCWQPWRHLAFTCSSIDAIDFVIMVYSSLHQTMDAEIRCQSRAGRPDPPDMGKR